MTKNLPIVATPNQAGQPSRRLRWLDGLSRWLLRLLLLLWLLAGLGAGLLHGFIVPRIGEFLPLLEQRAGQALGVPVRIGSIRMEAHGLQARIELGNVQLLGPAQPSVAAGTLGMSAQPGYTGLLLERVTATLSIKPSWRMGFDQLVLESPALDVRRTADGHVHVGGIDLFSSGTAVSHNEAANWLLSQTELVIRGGTVSWTDALNKVPPVVLSQVDAVLRNPGRKHLIRIDATLPALPGWSDSRQQPAQQISLQGNFRQPLLSMRQDLYQQWSGEAFADFGAMDLAQLAPLAAVASGLNQRFPALGQATGQAGLRAWADIRQGQLVGGTADVALQQAVLPLLTPAAPDLLPLALNALSLRIDGKRMPEGSGFAVKTQALQFQFPDFSSAWQGGSLALEHQPEQAGVRAQTQLKAAALDVAVWAKLAQSLPLAPAWQARMAALAPQGQLQMLEARWQQPLAQAQPVGGSADTAPDMPVLPAALPFSVKAVASGLAIASQAAVPDMHPVVNSAGVTVMVKSPGRPGFSGMDLDLQATQAGGTAALRMGAGQLDLPGIFEDPKVPMDRLSADLRWSVGPGTPHQRPAIDVQAKHVQFANADAQGELSIGWQTGLDSAVVPLTSAASTRFPGTLSVKGSISRGNGARVYRYLPQVLPEHTRRYVQNAVVRGDLSDVAFEVKGPVAKIPFNAEPDSGVFRISAKFKEGEFAYVPAALQPAGALAWPALTGASGELLFNQATLDVSNIRSTGVAGFPELRVERATARIASMVQNAAVEVDAQLRGPLASAIGFVNTSPLSGLTGRALADVSASNRADVRFKLNLPIHAVNTTQIEGSVLLAGNDITPLPGAATLAAARGTVLFSDKGFSLSGVEARLLGGTVQIEGGSVRNPASDSSPAGPRLGLALKAQGTATAEALRQALAQTGLTGQTGTPEAALLQRLARHASGSTSYSATIKTSASGNRSDVLVTSNLQGLALALPEPLGKLASQEMPLRFERLALAGSGQPEKITLNLNRSIALTVLRDTDFAAGAQQPLRGSLAVGLQEGESAPPLALPQTLALSAPVPQGAVLPGIAANIRLPRLDLDAWQKILLALPETASPLVSEGSTATTATAATSAKGTPLTAPATGSVSLAESALAASGFPTSIALRVDELVVEGYRLQGVVLGASRSASAWRANIQAEELAGYAEYRPPAGPADREAGQVYARLQRLKLATDTASQVENLLAGPSASAATSLPTSLPSLDIVIQDMELRGKKLGRVDIDAVNRPSSENAAVREWRLNRFNAQMPDASFTASGSWRANAAKPLHRTALDFNLDIQDSGALLTRLGMPGVVQRGQGVLQGTVQWDGSPLALDYASLSGQMQVRFEAGQFLKADPGIAKLLGVLSLQSLPRRLALDFRDVFSSGFAFDFVRGDVTMERGIASTRNMQMKGVNAAVLMEGFADTRRETQDLTVVVVPEINAGTASLIATAINPVLGLGSFMAQWLLRRPLMEAATQTFHISGSWQEPKVVKVGRDGQLVQN